MVEPVHVGRAALVSLRVDLQLDRQVADRDHAALAGRDLLVGVEPERRRVSPAPHPAAGAVASPAPAKSANAAANAVTRGPSESWPARRTARTIVASASPSTGLASGIGSSEPGAGR